MSLNRFDDVQVLAEEAGAGIRVRYVLTPLHPIDRIEFEGMLGLPEDACFESSSIDSATHHAQRAHRDDRGAAHGIPAARLRDARITSRLVETHDPDRATLVFEIEAGRRLTIADRRFTQRDADVQGTVTELPDIKPGQPFDDDVIERELRAWEDAMHARGFYEARASHAERDYRGRCHRLGEPDARSARGREIYRGSAARSRARTAGADSDRGLGRRRPAGGFEPRHRGLLYARGYRDANACLHEPGAEGGAGHHVRRRSRPAIPRPRRFVHRQHGDPGGRAPATHAAEARANRSSESTRSTGCAAIQRLYSRARVHARQVKSGESILVPENAADPDRETDVQIAIVEGPRT